MKKDISSIMKKGKKDAKARIVYESRKLGSQLRVKDETKLENRHNIVYHARCPNKKCTSEYTGQTRCRLGKRAIQHNKTDNNSFFR